jgi:hypothetical protein
MTAKAVLLRFLFFATAMILLGWISTSPTRALAQGCSPVAGNNLVYGNCSTQSSFGSQSYIDVSSATTSATGDLCARIASVLATSGLKAGTVVDARGIVPPTPLSCSSDPFIIGVNGSGQPIFAPPSVVLLPSGTITTSSSWVVPDETQLIGEGPGITTLQAASGFADPFVYAGTNGTANPAVIHMGAPNTSATVTQGIVFAVRILHLTVDGNRQTVSSTYIDGIDNNNAEEQSYVDDVTIQNVLANGLYLSADPDSTGDGAADHSGPYTNIVFQQTSGLPKSATNCVNITANVEPRGIHGISCLGDSTSAATYAILLNGNSTTIEDARIDGFNTGIYVGSTGDPTQANLLFNITGTDTVGSVTNLINIDNTGTGSSPINLAISAVSLTTSAGTPCTIDDHTTSTCVTNSSVGMYLLGQPVSTSNITYGYSRFTTSPNFATWIVGSTSASITGKSCTANGSIFSSTTGTGGSMWACVAGAWK